MAESYWVLRMFLPSAIPIVAVAVVVPHFGQESTTLALSQRHTLYVMAASALAYLQLEMEQLLTASLVANNNVRPKLANNYG
jgi:hypothetical protein